MLIIEFIASSIINLSSNIWSLLNTTALQDETRDWEDIS